MFLTFLRKNKFSPKIEIFIILLKYIIKYIIKILFSIYRSDEELLVSAYFTHSGTILKLLTLLGVAKDDQYLTHNLFSLYADDRAWRTGIIDTFASNIAFILYK